MTEDLDPFSLQRYVVKFKGSSTRDLSLGGEELYDRLLAQCCAYIIEIADKLPGFQTDAFGELLSRDRQILARLEDVLERIPANSQEGSGENRIYTAYRQRLATVLDRLELYGLDFPAKWYALSIASKSIANRREDYGAESVQEQIGLSPRLLIKGRAGTGKTTILQWLAVRAARTYFSGRASFLNDRSPFFLRLREYVGRELPTPEEYLDKLAPLLAPEGREWPRQQLKAKKGLVLIDGIDELPDKQRSTIGPWLHEMTELFPGNRYVLTTRPGAIDDDVFEEMGFEIAQIQPMTPTQIRRFIDQWHLAMTEWQIGEQERERIVSFKKSLLNRIQSDRFLRDLSDTPLLAGLICALNLYLNAVLPSRRGEIYEKALVMFDHRDKARGIPSDVQVDLAASNHLLGELALWMVGTD